MKMYNGTNLCHFVRVIVVYMPLILLAQVIFWAALVAAVVVLPIRWFGIAGYATTIGVAVGVVIAATGLVFGLRHISNIFSDWRDERRELRWQREDDLRRHPQPSPGPSVVSIAVMFVAAQKHKICPLVKFQGAGRHVHV